MDGNPRSLISRTAGYVRIDFGSCNVPELTATYRDFADLCIGTGVDRALLAAGDNEPEGHRQLRELLWAVARTAAIPPDFKLALVPSTPAIAEVYREAQQTFRAIGLNAWVFDTVAEALEWLEGRASSGRMVS